MDIDDVFTKIGVYGWSQKKVIYILGSSHTFLCFNILILTFIGTEPDWSCAPSSSSTSTSRGNVRDCVAYDKGECSPVYSDESSSIVSEWDLVCWRSSWANMSQSVFFVGWLIGSWLWGTVADKIGRKKVLFTNITVIILSGLGFGLAPNYLVFVLSRFASATGCAGVAISSNVLAVELVGMSARSFAGFFSASFISVGYVVLAVLAYFICSWRTLSVVVSLLGLAYFPLWRSIPESPRWLLVSGMGEEAIKVLTKIAHGNQTEMPENCDLKNQSVAPASRQSVSILSLCTGRNIRQRTLRLFLIWFVICMVYYALAMSAGDLGENKYVSFSLLGLVEIPALVIGYFVVDSIGRQGTLGGFLLVGGVSCLVWTACLWLGVGVSYRMAVALIGKFALTGAFASVYLYSSELIPTEVRNIGMGVTSIGARLGGILAPMVLLMASHSEGLPMMIMGGLATGAGLLSLTLPETLNQPMPETLKDLD